jgi:hypothetical protein
MRRACGGFLQSAASIAPGQQAIGRYALRLKPLLYCAAFDPAEFAELLHVR